MTVHEQGVTVVSDNDGQTANGQVKNKNFKNVHKHHKHPYIIKRKQNFLPLTMLM